MLAAIHKIEPINASDDVALEQLVALFGKLTTHRTQRLAASRDQLPALLRYLIMLLSAVVIGVFTLVPYGSLTLGVALKGIVAFALSFIFLIIDDIDHPFAGNWRIRDDLFEHFRDRLVGTFSN